MTHGRKRSEAVAKVHKESSRSGNLNNARFGPTPTKKPGGHPGLLARAPPSGGLVQQRSFVPKNFLKIYDMQGPVFEHSDALQVVARPFEGLG